MKRKHGKTRLLAAVALTLFICPDFPADGAEQKFQYPLANMETVVDNYHGTPVADPYRWLEDPSSPETQRWVEAQNQLTTGFLNGSLRNRLVSRLTELWNYPKYSVPTHRGQRYFFWKNDGLQNQYVLYMQPELHGQPRVVIDPNVLSPDGTVSLSQQKLSRDGTLLAYALSRNGSDWQTIHIRDVDKGHDFHEVLDQGIRFVGIAWHPDKTGFYYNRYAHPDKVENSQVYWHRLGTPQSQDKLVFERPDAKDLDFFPFFSEDDRYLILHVYHGTRSENRVYYREDSQQDFVRLLDQEDARYEFIDNVGSTFYFQTDYQAPRGRIIAIDTQKPAREHWQEIVPQGTDVISSVTTVANRLVVSTMHDAHHRLLVYRLDGQFEKELPLPVAGSISGLSGQREESEMFIGISSFLFPGRTYRYDFSTDKLEVYRDTEIGFDTSLYETRQVFVTSRDGTQVPVFLTHRKGLPRNGNNPVLLYGYGGFDISLTPFFSVANLLWMEQGGIYAVANLRGGGEYGEAWHKAGMLEKKQNVFDDFLASAEWLIQEKYTRPAKLAIQGGSNGGLLVLASMLQRPDLFGAVISQVPVTDMLRYHKFTVGRYWIPEYGNAEEHPEHFRFLYAYSPLHNVKKGVSYPPILVTSADTDDRVVPAHAKKFIATVQAAVQGQSQAPVLLRVETKAGHGGGKPTAKVIEEQGDVYAFLFKILGIDQP